MPRKPATTTKKTARKPAVRLKELEQVRDRKTDAVSFGSSVATYQPYSSLSVSQLRELIMSTVWVDVCVETIVDEVVKHRLYTDPENDIINSFLKYPSDKEPLFMIRKQYLKDMLKWGNGACIIEYKNNKPYDLVVIPGYTLRITDKEPLTYKFLKLGSSSTFKQDANNQDIELSLKEVMHFCINKDSDSTLANSPLERAYNDIVSDKESSKKFADFIRRGFYKPAFMSFKKGSNVGKQELEEMIEYMNALMVEGAKILGINKEVELKDIPFWNATDVIDAQRWVGLKIASVFKVPPFMLNLVQDVGSLNAREQKARFLENVVMPILEYESFMYTNTLVRKGFKKLDTEITCNVLGTKLNYDRSRIANMLIGKDESVLTVTEARKMFFNLPPKDEIVVNTKE